MAAALCVATPGGGGAAGMSFTPRHQCGNLQLAPNTLRAFLGIWLVCVRWETVRRNLCFTPKHQCGNLRHAMQVSSRAVCLHRRLLFSGYLSCLGAGICSS